MRADFSSYHHAARDLRRFNRDYRELKGAVCQQDSIPLLDIVGHSGVGDGYLLRISRDGFGGEDDGCAALQGYGFSRDLPQPNLFPAEVLEYGYRYARLCAQSPDQGDLFRMSLMISMGEVEPGHIHPLPDHLLHDHGVGAGRPKGTDYFCLFYLLAVLFHLASPPFPFR